MSGESARASRLVIALLLSLAATLVALALHLTGVDQRAELLALDLRFSKLANAPANDQLVHVDIDDRSLEELGRWPWPRTQLAGIVEVLSQAGATTVVLDIIMPEPQPTRYISPGTEVYSADFGELIGYGPAKPIFDDMALGQAMREAGNVFLPMHIHLGAELSTATERSTRGAIDAGKSDLAGVVEQILPQLQANTRSEDLDEVRRAYLRLRGLDALKRFALDAKWAESSGVGVGRITPPLVTLGQACYRSGFVTFAPDVDGVVRRIPMLAGDGKNTYPQFALALAADKLARKHGGTSSISTCDRAVTITCADGTKRIIPLDAEGKMLINWMPGTTSLSKPLHISAIRVGDISLMQDSIKRNRTLRRLLRFSLLEMAQKWPSRQAEDRYYRIADLDARLNEAYQKRIMAQRDVQRKMLFSPDNVPSLPAGLCRQEAEIEAEIDKLCHQFCLELCDENCMETFLGKGASADGNPSQQYQQRRAKADFYLAQIARAEAANRQIASDLAEHLSELRELVAGKMCIIGSAATGAADFVPTPVDSRMPGAWVHANIFNTIVSGVFVCESPLVADVAAILLGGIAVGLLAAALPVQQAGPLAFLVAVGYTATNAWVVFAGMNVFLPVVSPLAAMVASMLVVTAYCQMTEERAKRRIRGMFAHALSPALVDRLIADPSLAKLGGDRRELTCFFSDLQGFTQLAESLGEEDTIRLLNRYFDRMTDVVQNRHGGYLNKFLGDGLFVFFGAPVLEEDHASRAIHAAVDCQIDVALLNQELARDASRDVNLTVRIGIASGKVMVGNCGSSQRMDYTAIGDAVNLASRLESANKFFGTRILVSDSAWSQAGVDGMCARPMGKVRVVGKDESVLVWHVLGWDEDADHVTRLAFGRFEAGIELLSGRKFSEARQAFEEVLTSLPGDRPAEIFRELSNKYVVNPPPDDWDGSLVLAEK